MLRQMGEFDVKQRTKDGMFNATELIKQWNISKEFKGRKGKRIDDFINLDKTKEFIMVLQEDINTENSRYLKTYDSTRGKNGGTWMHPYLFIDFAMWINPKFKLSVIKFVYDQLIEQRHLAGDNYKGLTASATKLQGIDYAMLAKGLNWIVFGMHGKGLRQTATQEQLKELADVQKQLAFSIDMGMITTFDELTEVMRKMWSMKFNKSA